MGEHSKIEWTENTWSPWWGCQKISPACQNCYGDTLSHRWGRDCWGEKPRLMLSEAHWRKPLAWNRKAEREGRIIPVFPSMCDPFEDRPELVEPRMALFGLIRRTPNLFWLLLTKRPEHAADMLEIAGYNPHGGDSKNFGLGVTVESNDYTWRIAELLKVPAALHFISGEPLLSSLDVSPWLYSPCQKCQVHLPVDEWDLTICDGCPRKTPTSRRALGWVIAGGESRPKARPSHPDHFRSLRDQCQAAGVPFFFKGWGQIVPEAQEDKSVMRRVCRWEQDGVNYASVGKKAAGRLLDGRTWDEVPAVLEAPDA